MTIAGLMCAVSMAAAAQTRAPSHHGQRAKAARVAEKPADASIPVADAARTAPAAAESPAASERKVRVILSSPYASSVE